MGMYARAKVFWGYDLGDMTNDAWESTAPAWMYDQEDGETDRDWQEQLAASLGWVEAPWPDHVPYDRKNRTHEQHPDFQAYTASREEMHRIRKEDGPGVELDTYGVDGGETTWYVAIEDVGVTAEYDCPPLGDLTVQPDWPERIARFMELLELPVPENPPGWHVSSSYG